MNANLERRAISFIRTIANRCTTCLHRSPERCRTCVSQWANEIMTDYEADIGGSQKVDYSLAARIVRILDILQRAGRPLLASEIDISDVASKSLKEWTLRRMLRFRQIARTPEEGREDCILPRYRYFITDTTPTPERRNDNERNPTGAGRESGACEEA